MEAFDSRPLRYASGRRRRQPLEFLPSEASAKPDKNDFHFIVNLANLPSYLSACSASFAL